MRRSSAAPRLAPTSKRCPTTWSARSSTASSTRSRAPGRTTPRSKARSATASVAPFIAGHTGPGGWWILQEPGIELPEAPEVAPDLAGWRRERMRRPCRTAPFRVVPDWVCEILSTSTSRLRPTRQAPLLRARRRVLVVVRRRRSADAQRLPSRSGALGGGRRLRRRGPRAHRALRRDRDPGRGTGGRTSRVIQEPDALRTDGFERTPLGFPPVRAEPSAGARGRR